MAKRTAIIDIGSNSVRMVLFERTSRFAFHLLHEVKSRVRISEAAYENGGNLQEAAMERAIRALRDFSAISDAYGVRKTLCVATSAVRDAPNRTAFIKRVRRELGINVKVIDGTREAYLGGIACANLLPPGDAVTIDIGGGSTELALIRDGGVAETHSLDLGTVRLKELYFDRGDRAGAVACIDRALEALPKCDCGHAFGIGGTFRALARSLLKKSRHPLRKMHGYRIDGEKMRRYLDAVLEAPDNASLKKLGIKKERYDVIRPGALILLRILRHLEISELTASGVGVREGLYLADLLRNSGDRFPEHYNPSMRCLIDRYDVAPKQSQHLAATAKKLFDLMQGPLGIPERYRLETGIAARLCKIGTALHYYSHHQHSYYLAQTALEYGYTHEQIMLIATLVRFQKRKRPAREHLEDYESLLPDTRTLEYLSFILSLADALLSHFPARNDLSFDFDGTCIGITSASPLYLPKEAVATLQRPKGISVTFR